LTTKGFYEGILNAFKTEVEKDASIQQVVYTQRMTKLPLPTAIIEPREAKITVQEIGTPLWWSIPIDVILIVWEEEPENWMSSIVYPLGDIVDNIIDDRTLGGSVLEIVPTYFSPATIEYGKRWYWGGRVTFEALARQS
jgi:hypothetical protein